MKPTQPLYWSIRRELWENRSLYIAPLVTIGVVLFAFLVSSGRLPHRMRTLAALAPGKQHELVTMPYSVAAGLTIVMAFVVGVFYCLDALYGERRDRSILFWKSLPVSDTTTVLAKASIPLVVLPLFSFVIIIAAHLLMLLLSSLILLGSGVGVDPLWTRLPLFQMTVALLYSVVAIALWHAPIYGWMLLVSAWARRGAFLWAVFPLLAVAAFEKLAFGTAHAGLFLRDRLAGWYFRSFDFKAGDHTQPLTSMTPGDFLSAPGLWLGLVLAAAFIAAAVRLRRDREPI